MRSRIRRIRKNVADQGASAVEYGLMVAAIAAVIVGIGFGMGGVVKGAFSQTEDCIVNGVGAPNCNKTGP